MKLFTKNIKANEAITTFFALETLRLKTSKKRQQKYLKLELTDKTGMIVGYLWNDPVETAATIKENTVVKIKAFSQAWNDSLIMNVERVRTADTCEYSLDDFLEIVPGGAGVWLEKLHKVIDTITDTNCAALLAAFLGDERFLEQFIAAPGGLSIHHNYKGGLIEHTVSAMEMVSLFADRHPGLLDKDLLVTGAFLHDIGKTREMRWEISKEYTTEGKLLGHIILGILMLEEKLRTLNGIPADLAYRLRHMIASHHGNLEYGSPVKPSTAEALALHVMEGADARINHIYRQLNSSDPDKEWSSYDKILSTQIYQKKYTGKIQPLHVATANN